MSSEASAIRADVKCYYCGHISGQIVGFRHQPVRVENFVPRPGYQGEPLRPGKRLRCERCQGPVFLEELGQADLSYRALARSRQQQRSTQRAA